MNLGVKYWELRGTQEKPRAGVKFELLSKFSRRTTLANEYKSSELRAWCLFQVRVRTYPLTMQHMGVMDNSKRGCQRIKSGTPGSWYEVLVMLVTKDWIQKWCWEGQEHFCSEGCLGPHWGKGPQGRTSLLGLFGTGLCVISYRCQQERRLHLGENAPTDYLENLNHESAKALWRQNSL